MTKPRLVELPMQVGVVLRALDSGDWSGAPIADPQRMAFGPREDVLLELQLFLEEHLAQADPETLARFAWVEGTELIEVPVSLPLMHLPTGPDDEHPRHGVHVAAVVIPAGASRWITLPALGHTLFAKADEDVADVVGREAPRTFAARGTTADEHLRVFPPRRLELAPLSLKVQRPRAPVGGAVARKELKTRVRRRRADAVLRSVATPLFESARILNGPAVVGHDAVYAQLEAALSSSARGAVALIGESGIGKTALVYRYLRSREERPQIYATSGARLIAGMSARGQWEMRMRRVLDALSEADAILYFDDLADLFTRRAKGSIDLAGSLKPYLDAERVRIVGELRPRDVERCEAAHVGVFHSFRRLSLSPLDKDETEAVLEARRLHAEATADEDLRPIPTPAVHAPLVALLERFGEAEHFPGAAIKLYEELRASRPAGVASEGRTLGLVDLFEGFSARTGIPAFLLREDHALVLEEIEAALRDRVVGQAAAVRLIAETLCVVKAGLAPRGKPLASFLFAGPTGIGKTEVARALASYLFGAGERMVRFDMSEYMDPYAAQRLIQGIGREEGLLTRQLRRQPFSVILLDEIEKAHPAVFDLLLQVLGEGRLSDARGQTVSFENALMIMTSNLGSQERGRGIGFGDRSQGSSEVYARAVEARFRPEFVARLDRVVVFHALEAEHTEAIARMAVTRIGQRRGFVDRGVRLELSDARLAALAAGGHSGSDGARALRRHLERELVVPAARVMATLGGRSKGVLRATPSGLQHEEDEDQLQAVRHVDELSRLRREADHHLRRDRVQIIASQIDYLTAQMSSFQGDEGGRLGVDLGYMIKDHDRLTKLFGAVEGPVLELCRLEEEALISADGEEEISALADEARLQTAGLQRALLDVLLRGCAQPDRCFLLAQEVAHGGLLRWLRGLATGAAQRRWELRVHLDGDKDKRWGPAAAGAGKPGQRRFGPARPVSEVDERARSVVVELRGARAGAFAALEAGVIQFHNLGTETERVLVHRLPLLREDKDEDWSRPAPIAPDKLKDLPIARWRSRDCYERYSYALGRYLMIPWAEYWRRYEEIALAHLLHFEDDTTLDPADVYRVSKHVWPS